MASGTTVVHRKVFFFLVPDSEETGLFSRSPNGLILKVMFPKPEKSF